MSLNETYKRDLLRKYLEGSISDAERHELEKIALDDPFIFDAMEGVTLHQAAHKSNVNDLQSRLNPKDAKVIRPAFWKRISVAAGVLVLVTALFFVNRQFNSQEDMAAMRSTEKAKQSSEEIAESSYELEDEIQEPKSVEPRLADEENTLSEISVKQKISNVAETVQFSSGASEQKRTSSTISNDVDQTISKNEEVIIAPPPPIVAEVQKTTVLSSPKIDTQNETIQADTDTYEVEAFEPDEIVKQTKKLPQAKNKESTRSQTEIQKTGSAPSYAEAAAEEESVKEAKDVPVVTSFDKNQNTVIDDSYDILVNPSYGTVTDESGEALIGANVFIVGSSIGVITDFDGKFELPDSISYPVLLEVSYTGYNSTSILLQEPTANIAFVMDSDGMLLDEVVVASKAERKKKTSASYSANSDQSSDYDASKVHFVEGNSFPEIGGSLFDKYFAEELERRNACVQQGTYQFKFVVKRNGKLSDVNLANPSNVNCEEMLIEIFEKGGNWIPKESKGKTYTQYTLKIP